MRRASLGAEGARGGWGSAPRSSSCTSRPTVVGADPRRNPFAVARTPAPHSFWAAGTDHRPSLNVIPSRLDKCPRSQMSLTLPSFPNPVDEVSARLVAGGVLVLAASFVITTWTPLVAVLAYGFVARVLAGPRLSPLGLLLRAG